MSISENKGNAWYTVYTHNISHINVYIKCTRNTECIYSWILQEYNSLKLNCLATSTQRTYRYITEDTYVCTHILKSMDSAMHDALPLCSADSLSKNRHRIVNWSSQTAIESACQELCAQQNKQTTPNLKLHNIIITAERWLSVLRHYLRQLNTNFILSSMNKKIRQFF